MTTISDVAVHAGVSVMTVSRYFNDPTKLAASTYERVKVAVDELGYVPNATARSLIRGRSDTVALVVADIRHPFFIAIARGVEEVAQAAKYVLFLGNSRETLARERQYLETVISRRVDGVILAPTHGKRRDLEVLRQRGVPTVLIDRRLPDYDLDVVVGDTFTGGRILTEHLVAEGYRDIAFVGGTPGVSSLVDRLGGYERAMAQAGLAPRSMLGRYDQASGERLVGAMVAAARRGEASLPDALIAANDMVALGALLALRRHGIRVPEDMAVAGFDDFDIASQLDPFLTVVRQPAYDIGREAMQLLLQRFEQADRPTEERVLPVELVARRSTRRSG